MFLHVTHQSPGGLLEEVRVRPIQGSGVLTTYATLYADYDYGKATTSCGKGSGVTLSTTIIYYFTNASGHTQTSSSSGTTSASAGCVTSQGQKASSQHSVRGGTTWGSWSCSLSTTAW